MLPESFGTDAAVSYFHFSSADDERFSLYSYLAASFRSGALAELLGNTIRLLLLAVGKDVLRGFIDGYVARTPPAAFPTDEAVQFRNFMRANPLPIAGLDEILKFEASIVEAAANIATVRVTISKDIDMMLADLAAGRLPGPSSDRPPTVIEIGVDPFPFVREMEVADFQTGPDAT
jgi:hypothetical protein